MKQGADRHELSTVHVVSIEWSPYKGSYLLLFPSAVDHRPFIISVIVVTIIITLRPSATPLLWEYPVLHRLISAHTQHIGHEEHAFSCHADDHGPPLPEKFMRCQSFPGYPQSISRYLGRCRRCDKEDRLLLRYASLARRTYSSLIQSHQILLIPLRSPQLTDPCP